MFPLGQVQNARLSEEIADSAQGSHSCQSHAAAWSILTARIHGTSVRERADRLSCRMLIVQLPGGALVPIHQRMVSVQPIATVKPLVGPSEAVCVVQ
jgi:hypothetical protein